MYGTDGVSLIYIIPLNKDFVFKEKIISSDILLVGS